jgi:hypothetical protein
MKFSVHTAHLADLRREHLIDQVCTQEILPLEQ